MPDIFKKFIIYLGWLIAIWLIFIIFPTILIIKEDVLISLFSVTIGAFIALLAFLALVEVSGLQQMRNFVYSYMRREKWDDYKFFCYTIFFGLENVNWENVKNRITPGASDLEKQQLLKLAFERLKDISTIFHEFVIVTIILIFLSLFFLITTPTALATNFSYYFGLFSLSTIVFFSCWSLINSFKIIMKIFFEKPPREEN